MGQIRHKTINQNLNTELSIICDLNKSSDIPKGSYEIVEDWKEIISAEIDAVFICTPNHLIPKLVSSFLDNGKHVFAEKPPGRNLSDILRMREYEKKNPDRKLMFGFNHRYHPGIMKAKSIIDSRQFGNVVALRGLYGKSGGVNFKDSWRNEYSISGGGILLDQGIHMLDLFNLFIGSFSSAKAFLSNDHWNLDVEDNAMVIFRNEKNQLASLHSSATFWKHTFELNVILENGYLKHEGLLSKSGSYGREKLTIGNRQFEDESDAVGNPSEEIIYFDKDLSWEIELEKFTNYILNDLEVDESNSNDALNAMDLVNKCYLNSGFDLYKQGGD